MDYQKLTKRYNTREEFEQVCENWYARLNRLTDRFNQLNNEERENLITRKILQVRGLANIMAGRLFLCSQIYREMTMPILKQPFAPGGVIFGEEQREIFVDVRMGGIPKNEFIIPQPPQA